MKSCKKCIWFDKCGSDKPCKYFSTYNEQRLAISEYKKDLRNRQKYYTKLISEMKGDA